VMLAYLQLVQSSVPLDWGAPQSLVLAVEVAPRLHPVVVTSSCLYVLAPFPHYLHGLGARWPVSPW
jgi:hypothetical protein